MKHWFPARTTRAISCAPSNHILPLDGIDVVELGAGTGRLTCLLAPLVQSIQAFDISPHMLEVASTKLEASGLHNWKTAGQRSPPDPAAGWRRRPGHLRLERVLHRGG